MKLEQPILFHSLKELQEAVKYGIFEKFHIEFYESKFYTLPTLFWSSENGVLDHQNNTEILLDQDDEFLPILRKSLDWKDVRDKYKPKEWYELESNIGKPIWVRDHLNDKWNLTTFQRYDNKNMYPFIDSDMSNWKYAEPVTEKDLIHEI